MSVAPAFPLAPVAIALCAGVAFACLWLAMLRSSVEALADGRPARAVAAGIVRLVVAGGLFLALVQFGAAPVVAALGTFVLASRMALKRVSGA